MVVVERNEPQNLLHLFIWLVTAWLPEVLPSSRNCLPTLGVWLMRQLVALGHPMPCREGLCPCGHCAAGMEGLHMRPRVAGACSVLPADEHVCIRSTPGLFPEAPSVDTWLPEPRIQPSLFVLVSCDCRDKAPQTGLGRGRLQTTEMDSQSPEAEIKIEVMAGPCSLRAP